MIFIKKTANHIFHKQQLVFQWKLKYLTKNFSY